MTPPPSDAARATPPRTQFFGAVLWGMVAVLALAAVWLAAFKLEHQIPFVDFQVLWTGGRMTPDEAYRQAFPYPPSALLLLAPIARLGFGLAGPLWTGLTLAAFAGVSWRLLPECRRAVGLALVVLTPGAAWAAVSGQASFLIGALVVSGTAMLERRPWLAGVALGAAAAVKPSDLVLAPVALIAGRHWRALLGRAGDPAF